MHYTTWYYGNLMKNKNNINTLVSKNEFKIIALTAIFGVILISSILTLNNKGIVILAQSNTSTNSTSSSQSDDQTTGVEPNPRSNLTRPYNTDRDGDGILDGEEIPIDRNQVIPILTEMRF